MERAQHTDSMKTLNKTLHWKEREGLNMAVISVVMSWFFHWAEPHGRSLTLSVPRRWVCNECQGSPNKAGHDIHIKSSFYLITLLYTKCFKYAYFFFNKYASVFYCTNLYLYYYIWTIKYFLYSLLKMLNIFL